MKRVLIGAWVLGVSSAVIAAGIVVNMSPSADATTEGTSISAYTTAYSYFDNTPRGSTRISNPILHKTAGGTGSYADPVTLAVGHSITNGRDVLDVPAGTRFYIPDLRKYAIVEDTCGDGDSPQDGPCHRLDTPGNKAPKGASIWVDVWAGGQTGSTRSQVDKCMSKITDGNGALHTIIRNPSDKYLVVSGDVLYNGTCRANYGNTPVLSDGEPTGTPSSSTSSTPPVTATPTATKSPRKLWAGCTPVT